MISEPTVNLERKGIDPEPMPNYCRFIFASNHDHIVKAGLRERRYLVLEPCGKKAQHKDYFDVLWNWVNSGGASSLLDYLQRYDLSQFDHNRAPATKALIEEKLASLKPADLFIYEQIGSPLPFSNSTDGGNEAVAPARIKSTELVDMFSQWMGDNGEAGSKAAIRASIGKAMARIGLKAHGRSDSKAGKVYELPVRSEMCQRFAKVIGHQPDEMF